MTEIRLDIELAHPPERVWRALTDRRLLGAWFMSTDLRPVSGYRFRLWPDGLRGFDGMVHGQVVEAEPPRRLVMLWQAPELEAKVSMSLARASGGCLLTMRQSGFLGVQGTLRRRDLHRTYAQMLGRRLPDVLAGLSIEDGRGGAVGTALARRRSQRLRTAPDAARADAGSRGNAARLFQRGRLGAGRRIRAVGRVRVMRPLNQEATVAFAISAPAGTRRRGRGRPVRGYPLHAGSLHGGRVLDHPAGAVHAPAHGRATHARRAALPPWQRRLVALRARSETSLRLAGPTLRRQASAAMGALRGLPRWPMERRSRAVALGASLLLLIGVVSVIVAGATATHPARPPQVGGGADSDPGYAEQPGRPAPVVEMSRDRSPAAVTAPANPGQSAATVGSVLTAAYHTESSRLGGYRGSVTIINPSRDTVIGWTVVMTLAPLSLAGEAAGVQRTQHGQTVTFTPTTDTRLITPGGNVVFTLEVDGVGSPSGCTIDGKACSGIPE